MKKLIAVLLVAVMALSLFACGTAGTGGNNSTNSVEDTKDVGIGEVLANGTAGPDYDGPKTGEAYYGFFDNEYDYSKDETYKIAYVAGATNVLYEAFSQAFELWAKRYNCEYSFITCNGDSDLMLNTIQTLAGEGVKGFFVDPDSQVLPRVSEVCQELVGDAWMSCMVGPFDDSGKINHPFVGFNDKELGRQEAEYVVNYAKETWDDFSPENAVLVNCNYSISSNLNLRMVGAKEYWEETYPEYKDRFVDLDLVSGHMVEQDAYDNFSTLVSQRSDVKYWLITATFDTYAQGCARVAEEYGIADNTVITAIGGTALINEWDSGLDSCWRSAIFSAQTLYAEPIFGAMYYMMRGWCTAQELWPDYVNENTNGYGQLYLASFCIEKDNYQDYLEWVDWHSGFDYYKYTPYDEATGTPYDLILKY